MFSLHDKQLSKKIVQQLKEKEISYKFMHVCGTHQDTLMKHGLDTLLKSCGIEIIQGPGCPVCVTTPKEIEEMILLGLKGKTITTFGDMLQVPGENHSLSYLRTEGCDIKTVYSIEDAVDFAKQNKSKEVVFMAVGFETTAPTTASVILNEPPENFSILCCHRTIPNALKTIVEMGEIRINGLIEPGHVSAIIGTEPYAFLSKKYHIPQVITGFDPMDILMAVWMLAKQIEKDEPYVQNEYKRVVSKEGNKKASSMLDDVFKLVDMSWRGFPVITKSGLTLKNQFESYDARKKFEDILEPLKTKKFTEPKGCRCGELLRGLITSKDCPLFGTICTPQKPVGPCMVSVEGSCNIFYKYDEK
ncbi:hydrogenase formation protein HypD [Thermoplasmatales archaeon ex4572_165]|nr:MAG: hydrogenase formation protein HypD [Thermoplasmatales archaeon ex4572_165]RLF59951.1 MAG: hydrogenase formation protein HypD [Thermoplasmata archaeon]